jgi:pimeloyl-ACP methyl ester carboxylesterase
MDSDNQLSDAETADLAARASATHLVVFQHGLLGSEADFANAQSLFQSRLGPPLYAYNARCNATTLDNVFATCDGIDCGAERLACEIVRVAETMPRLDKFSLVGHSMGGLYARYCLGVLYARGFFDRIEPVVRRLKSYRLGICIDPVGGW